MSEYRQAEQGVGALQVNQFQATPTFGLMLEFTQRKHQQAAAQGQAGKLAALG